MNTYCVILLFAACTVMASPGCRVEPPGPSSGPHSADLPKGVRLAGLDLRLNWMRKYPRNFSWAGPEDVGFGYDHFLTWLVYGEMNVKLVKQEMNRENAVYLLDGEDLGRGIEGWSGVIKRLRSMPKRSRIAIFPDYDQDVPWLATAPYSFPFVFYAAIDGDLDLYRTILDGDLVLIGCSNESMMQLIKWPTTLPDWAPHWRRIRGEQFLSARPGGLDCRNLPENFSWKCANDGGFAYEHYFTWFDYGIVDVATGKELREKKNASYVFDGEELGRGEGGFRKAIERFKGLPRGATVVMFPDYDQDIPGFPTEAPCGFPFDDYWRKDLRLYKTIIDYGLRLISSSNIKLVRPVNDVWPKPKRKPD